MFRWNIGAVEQIRYDRGTQWIMQTCWPVTIIHALSQGELEEPQGSVGTAVYANLSRWRSGCSLVSLSWWLTVHSIIGCLPALCSPMVWAASLAYLLFLAFLAASPVVLMTSSVSLSPPLEPSFSFAYNWFCFSVHCNILQYSCNAICTSVNLQYTKLEQHIYRMWPHIIKGNPLLSTSCHCNLT